MFIGKYEHNIDSKGRVIVPAKFREQLGSVFYICQELNNCLSIYKKEDWEAYVEKLNKLPSTNPNALAFKRFKLSEAYECVPDNNGRILIPQSLRDYAGITKEIVSTGNGDTIEMWDKNNWEQYRKQFNETLNSAIWTLVRLANLAYNSAFCLNR